MPFDAPDRVLTYYRRLWELKSGPVSPAWTRGPGTTRTDVARSVLWGGERLLDVGCWGGEALQRMNAAAAFRELYAVDLLESSVAAARARGIRAEVVDLNRQSLPYEHAFFDAATCLAVLAQLFDPASTVAELRRVLRPKGQLVLSVPNLAVLPNRLKLLLGRRPRTSPDPGWDGGQLNYFTLADTRRLLERGGFTIHRVHAVGRWVVFGRFWPALLSRDLVFDAVRAP